MITRTHDRRQRRIIGLCAVTLAGLTLTLLTATRSGAQAPLLPFVVGIWAGNDAILPFADFDGRRWRNSWPQPVDGAPADVPLPRIPATWWGSVAFQPSWEVVEPGGRRRDVRIVATDWTSLGSSCAGNIGLKADVANGTYPFGSALASSRPGVLASVDPIVPASAEWRTLSALLPGIYRQHEALAWKDVSEDFRPDMAAPLSSPRIVQAFTATDETGQYVYFESVREFARRREQQGDNHSFITGWLWRRSAAMPFQAVTLRAATNDGDGKSEASFHPLGVVRHGAQRFWLGMLSRYAHGALAVFDVRRAGIRELLLAEYAGC